MNNTELANTAAVIEKNKEPLTENQEPNMSDLNLEGYTILDRRKLGGSSIKAITLCQRTNINPFLTPTEN
jgi:hypothetical protein